jgi:hypothetical protein
LHPHLKLDKTMTSVPAVSPGDMVFWHCVSINIYLPTPLISSFGSQDVVHAVEEEHRGDGDSAGAYFYTTVHTTLLKFRVL